MDTATAKEDYRPISARLSSPPAAFDGEFTVASPTKRQSPIVLVGTGVVGILLVASLIVIITMQAGSRTAIFSTGGPSAEDHQQETRLVQDRREVKQQQKHGQAFEEAKKLLTESLSFVGGTAENNVKKGIELLKQHLSRPNASNQTEARRLLEYAQITLSDEKATAFLLSLEDYNRRQFAGETISFTPISPVIVEKSRLERLSPGFSGIYKTKVEKEGEETSVFIEEGEYHSSMENAFFDRLKKNVKASMKRVAKQEADAKLGRERQRQEKERQAVLQNGTDEFKRIVVYPEKYLYGHYYFDGVFGSNFGNTKRA